MLMLISPAKSLDETARNPSLPISECDFTHQAQTLMAQLIELAPADLSALMHISDDLAQLNFERNQAWLKPTEKDGVSKQALMMFKGDVYQGLEASTLDEEGLNYAQTHLRILSGLYGLLRPMDLMRPYRLEMGTKFANSLGKDLYAFWGEQITNNLNQTLAQAGKPIVNLASNEYFKAVKPKKLNSDVITPIFKDLKSGQYKIVSFYAKKARGLMVRYAIDKKIEQVEDLKYFDYAGYQFSPELSNDKDWVFTRDQAV
ncbi:peroxide stress protein YaaA [Thiomicrospira microaerophila]|uniref:peroxide stress protein YaaA n=1 Tax=Thiomicrospira microaerophila TaxID=406020 RepID=UPI0005C8FA90|nr:peroxide stress protein YaaA [Thiomicrospira microaerophila]